MSNHLHLIVAGREGKLSDIIRDFKKFTASKILEEIDTNCESRRHWMIWIFKSKGEKNIRNKVYQFWQQDNHPIELETNAFKDQKLNYIHMNPVKAGIVDEPEHYRWSSARDYAGMKGLAEVEFL